ncbi:MAG: DUF2063 domain-containing protein [Gammaproteobacteria bacterium HGW-Gammaproteobacteria-3]|nr:MAG: DUF2063 domain-containing protein [Gammaproteobacteria bacterium HGW-Gammaproteobacteria-3]
MSINQSPSNLRKGQQAFAAYIRDPKHQPAPGDVKPERMAMYRELFFNNVEAFLSSNFPVLRSLSSDDDWLQLVQDFFTQHACASPYFSEIPEEFLHYLQNERQETRDLPFMLELAHYEWAEMALTIAKEATPPKIKAKSDLFETPLALSPLVWPLVYRYPVQRIGPQFIPDRAPEQATFLLMYRNDVDVVKFFEITPMSYRLLEMIQEYPGQSGDDYLRQLADSALKKEGTAQSFFRNLADRVIIYSA